MHTYFFRYSVSSLMASGILPFALRMATRRFREAAFVSSCLMMESSKSSASSYLNHKTPKDHHLPHYIIQHNEIQICSIMHACMHNRAKGLLNVCVCVWVWMYRQLESKGRRLLETSNETKYVKYITSLISLYFI